MSCRHVYLSPHLYRRQPDDHQLCWLTTRSPRWIHRRLASQPKVGKDFNSCKKSHVGCTATCNDHRCLAGVGGLYFPRNQDTVDDSLDAALSRDRGETGRAHEMRKSKKIEAAVVRMICLAVWFFSKRKVSQLLCDECEAQE
jgi:hypothetical protein